MILLIDNYDSFTYNLVHYLADIGVEVEVKRNDALTVEEALGYDAVIISPGPCDPDKAGICLDVIKQSKTTPIFGVCLGLQAIGECFGASLKNLSRVYHGVQTPMMVSEATEKIFENVATTFEAGRYHSWVIDKTTLPDSELEVTCVDKDGEIMAIRHKKYNVRAVQFHPESIMTADGKQMLKNYLKYYV